MSYAQTLFSFTDTNTIYFGKARQKTKYIAWEHLKRPGVTEWYHHGNFGHPYKFKVYTSHYTFFGKFYLPNPISRILLLCQKMNCDISTLNVIK